MMPEKFTVLGGGGFVGRNVSTYLQLQGHEVSIPARDLSDFDKINPGHVIYCIGLTADFRIHPLDTVEAHVCLLTKILRDIDFKSFTYLSSTRIYDGEDTSENSAVRVNPVIHGDLYNISKLMGESVCLNSHHKNIKVARLSNIVGVRKDKDLFIDQLLDEAVNKGRIQLKTALNSSKDYIYIYDVVSALEKIALMSDVGIFNVASGSLTSNKIICEYISKIMKVSYDVDADAQHWSNQAIDISRIESCLNFTPSKFENYFPVFISDYIKSRGL